MFDFTPSIYYKILIKERRLPLPFPAPADDQYNTSFNQQANEGQSQQPISGAHLDWHSPYSKGCVSQEQLSCYLQCKQTYCQGRHSVFGPKVQTSSKLDIISMQKFHFFLKHFYVLNIKKYKYTRFLAKMWKFCNIILVRKELFTTNLLYV